jgi:type IV pilus assembly protein PilM
LQQDLVGHVFDVAVMTRPSRDKQPVSQKNKVLVAGAQSQLINNIQAASKSAGWVADHIIPGLIAPVNAFESAMPNEFGSQALALVDIGYKSTTICLMNAGEVVMSRVVAIGGDRLTSGLAEAMNISYAEAEGIKIGMPTEVQAHLDSLIVPLGRELRASIDFFEHQQDTVVSGVYLSGGSSRSDFVLEILRQELMKECRTWDPLASLQIALPPQKNAELEHIRAQLSVAVGGALTALN